MLGPSGPRGTRRPRGSGGRRPRPCRRARGSGPRGFPGAGGARVFPSYPWWSLLPLTRLGIIVHTIPIRARIGGFIRGRTDALPVRVRSSRWVLEPLFMSPAWILVLVFSAAVLWVLGPVTVIL